MTGMTILNQYLHIENYTRMNKTKYNCKLNKILIL